MTITQNADSTAAPTRRSKTTTKSTPNFATAAAKPRRKAKPCEMTQLRDNLPFFKKGRGAEPTSWWNVSSTGDYSTDVDLGKSYARDFIQLLMFNAGTAFLTSIISDMAKTGRDPSKNPKDTRGIDNVALGFMMQIGDSLQSAIVGLAIAGTAIRKPDSNLGTKFTELLETGALLRGESRSSLHNHPAASIFDRH